jgi:hypothetical protein
MRPATQRYKASNNFLRQTESFQSGARSDVAVALMVKTRLCQSEDRPHPPRSEHDMFEAVLRRKVRRQMMHNSDPVASIRVRISFRGIGASGPERSGAVFAKVGRVTLCAPKNGRQGSAVPTVSSSAMSYRWICSFALREFRLIEGPWLGLFLPLSSRICGR